MNRTKPRFRTVVRLFLGALTQPLFLYGAPYKETAPYKNRGFVRFLTLFLGALTL